MSVRTPSRVRGAPGGPDERPVKRAKVEVDLTSDEKEEAVKKTVSSSSAKEPLTDAERARTLVTNSEFLIGIPSKFGNTDPSTFAVGVVTPGTRGCEWRKIVESGALVKLHTKTIASGFASNLGAGEYHPTTWYFPFDFPSRGLFDFYAMATELFMPAGTNFKVVTAELEIYRKTVSLGALYECFHTRQAAVLLDSFAGFQPVNVNYVIRYHTDTLIRVRYTICLAPFSG